MTSPLIAKVLFLDSMVYMHYKPIEDVDWLAEASADQVTIVVPRVTLKELDKHKNTHSSTRIRDRVAGILKRLEKYLPAGFDLRPRVSIRRYQKLATNAELEAKGLNADWADDVLIGTALLYRSEHPEAEVVLVTQDTGPRLTALDHNLTVLKLPESLRLPADPDRLQKENEELRQQILKQQKAGPELRLAFTGHDQNFIEVVLDATIPPSTEASRRALAEMEAKYPRVSHSESKGDSYLVPPPEEYTRYNRERENYISGYEKYLAEKWLLHLFIPDGVTVHERDSSSRTPGEPTPPRPVRTAGQIMADQMRSGMGAISESVSGFADPFSRPESSGLTIKRTNSYEDGAHRDAEARLLCADSARSYRV